MTDYGLDSRVVLITGAAGGFGQAMARVFSERGSRVVLSDLRDEGEDVAREVGGAFFRADILRRAGGERPVPPDSRHRRRRRRAGQQRRLPENIDPVDDFDEDVWCKMIEVMLTAAVQADEASFAGHEKTRLGKDRQHVVDPRAGR